MKIIAIIARILLGLTFIFSGFVKGIDPWGSTYKFIDYFNAFNMSWMDSLAFTLAVLQNTVEFVIGAALVLGLRMKETAWGVLVFMVFYTILTLVLAFTNPVTDCGCFGDALILTNWETFFKNLFLMLPTLIVFFYRKKYVPAYGKFGEWGWITVTTTVFIAISIHCYRHLPWIDFRPYHVGADIPQGMTIPDDMPSDVYHSTVILEKDGERKEFPANNYPWDDSTWVWKETKNVLIQKGYTPPIHDFKIENEHGDDITGDVLFDQSYSFLLVAHRLNKSDKHGLKKAKSIADFCDEQGYRFYCLTASIKTDVELLKKELGLDYEFCTTDEITLKTIIRSNPGLVLLHNGTVIGKWHFNDMPDAETLIPNLLSFALEHREAKADERLNYLLLLALIFFGYVVFQNRYI